MLRAMLEVYSDQYGPGIVLWATPYNCEVLFDTGRRVVSQVDRMALRPILNLARAHAPMSDEELRRSFHDFDGTRRRGEPVRATCPKCHLQWTRRGEEPCPRCLRRRVVVQLDFTFDLDIRL